MPKIARADVVGSLLRPQYLLDARKAWREGKLDDKGVHAVEDRAVAEAVALQESAGIDAVTDGEYRRFNFVATMGVRDARDGCLSGFETVQTRCRGGCACGRSRTAPTAGSSPRRSAPAR